MAARRLDASSLRDWAHTAVGDLISHTDEINRLNVFPVADADTGTNMLFTMRSAWARADALAESADVAEVAAALAEGALHGARGNSGVILSQILRGLADVTADRAADRANRADRPDRANRADRADRPDRADRANRPDLDHIDGALFSAALRRASVLVVASMGGPVAGTIVSVLQDAASAAEHAASAAEHAASAAEHASAQAELADVVFAAAEAAAVALDKTTGQLDVLAEAGVVDAGGRGLLVLLDAMSTTLAGHAPHRDEYLPSPPHRHEYSPPHRHEHQPHRGEYSPPQTDSAPPTEAAPQFEVMYLLSDCDADGVETLRERLDQLGESVAIAAAAEGAGHYSVHVHADDAGGAVEAALPLGTPSRIQITSLTGARPPGGWSRERAVLAVVDGDGAAELFAGEGAHILRPDDAAPVTAKQLLHALVNTGAAQIMVLPNGYVAAEELVAGCTAATGWGIDVVPVPAGSMVQGLAALAVHDAARVAVDDGYTMARAAAAARYGSVRVATEEALTWAGTCKPGDGLGIAGDEVLIVGDSVTAAGAGLIDLLLAAGGELVTVLTGAGVDAGVGAALQEYVHDKHLGAELVTYHTDHRGDALLIGVE